MAQSHDKIQYSNVMVIIPSLMVITSSFERIQQNHCFTFRRIASSNSTQLEVVYL